MNCKYLQNNRCSLAERLTRSNLVIIPTEQQCKVCSEEPNSKSINRVTASLAIGHLTAEYGKDAPLDTINILKVFIRRLEPEQRDWSKIGKGTGSWVHKILGWFRVKPIPGCNCVAIAEEMNKHDSNWSIQNKDELSNAIFKNALEWMHYKVNMILIWIYNIRLIKWLLFKSVFTVLKLAIYLQKRQERNSNAETSSQIGSFTG